MVVGRGIRIGGCLLPLASSAAWEVEVARDLVTLRQTRIDLDLMDAWPRPVRRQTFQLLRKEEGRRIYSAVERGAKVFWEEAKLLLLAGMAHVHQLVFGMEEEPGEALVGSSLSLHQYSGD